MTDEDREKYRLEKDCHICEKPLSRKGRLVKKVWNPNSGEFLGEPHRMCGKRIIGPMNEPEKVNKSSRRCVRCSGLIVKETYLDKVRDHCHITGM